jgi:hypothetical protein
MRALHIEELVRPNGLRGEIVSFRVRWETMACIDAFAKERSLTRSDAMRQLLRDGLEANGW